MVLGVHGQVVDRRRVRQVLRHRPRHQHAVALEPEVVVQPSGVVFLDDERVVVARRRAPCAAPVPVSCPRRACCGRSSACRATGSARRVRRAGHRLGRLAPAPRRSAGAAGRGPRSPPRCVARRRSDCSRPRSEYGAIVVFAELFWLQSRNTLPARRLFVIVAVTCLGIVFSSCCGDPLGQHRGAARADRILQRHVEVQALAAAGQRIGRQTDVGDEVADLVGHFAQLAERHVVAGVEVEHDAGRRAGSLTRRRRTATAARAPPARPAGAIHASPSTVSMIG